MSRTVDILDYLPKVVRTIKEFEVLGDAENPEINNLWLDNQIVLNNQFVATLDEDGCERWEKMLNISPKESSTLEDRRLAILARINASLPYTYRQLENFLRNICADDYTMTLDHTNYTLTVLLSLSRQNQFDEVANLLTRVIPANLICNVSLKYNQYKIIKPYRYRLLVNYTCYEIRVEENFADDVNEYLELESYSYANLEDFTFRDIALN